MLLRPRRPLLLLSRSKPNTSVLTPTPTKNNTTPTLLRFNNTTMSTAAAAAATTNKNKFAFLQELGISASEPGVCDGREWFASGPVRRQINPATGEVIAEVCKGGCMPDASPGKQGRGCVARQEEDLWHAYRSSYR